jgi:hypothetical protein
MNPGTRHRLGILMPGLNLCRSSAWLAAFFCLAVLQAANVYGQTTPGLIYKPAEGGGRLILNPSGHGFASETTAGFSFSDVVESEIRYHALPQLQIEPIGDTRTGSSGGHTDLVDNGEKQTAFLEP